MKRILLVLAAVLVLLLVVLFFAGGSIVRAGVETGTAYCLDVPVKVGGGSLNVLTGSVGLSSMEIANPPGFQGAHCFKVATIGVGAQLTSLMSDTIVVNEILVDAAELAVEAGPGGTNLLALKSRMDKKLGQAPAPKEGAAGRKYLVKLMTIKNSKLQVSQPLGAAKLAPIAIPEITIRDIGYDGQNSGATLSQLLTQVLDELAAAAGRSASGLPKEIASALEKEGVQAAQDLHKAAEVSVKTGDIDGVKKAAEEATQKIGDIFKPKK